MPKKDNTEKEGQILPALDTVVVSKAHDGDVMLKISRNMSDRDAALLLKEAIDMLPIISDEVDEAIADD